MLQSLKNTAGVVQAGDPRLQGSARALAALPRPYAQARRAAKNALVGGLLTVCSLHLTGGCTASAVTLRFGAEQTAQIPGVGPCSDGASGSMELASDRPLAVLVHGCNSSSGRLRALADVLERGGVQVACFHYDDRESIRRSAAQLHDALRTMEPLLRDREVLVVGHSQGGLVARSALVDDGPTQEPLSASYQLVTVSTPFGGVEAARTCSRRWLHFVTLGVTASICRAIAGANWNEIHPSAAAVERPRPLAQVVRQHLMIRTEERDTCRKWDLQRAHCRTDDLVFSLTEQTNARMTSDPRVQLTDIAAGHAEIVGETGVGPSKLISALQSFGALHTVDVAPIATSSAALFRSRTPSQE